MKTPETDRQEILLQDNDVRTAYIKLLHHARQMEKRAIKAENSISEEIQIKLKEHLKFSFVRNLLRFNYFDDITEDIEKLFRRLSWDLSEPDEEEKAELLEACKWFKE